MGKKLYHSWTSQVWPRVVLLRIFPALMCFPALMDFPHWFLMSLPDRINRLIGPTTFCRRWPFEASATKILKWGLAKFHRRHRLLQTESCWWPWKAISLRRQSLLFLEWVRQTRERRQPIYTQIIGYQLLGSPLAQMAFWFKVDWLIDWFDSTWNYLLLLSFQLRCEFVKINWAWWHFLLNNCYTGWLSVDIVPTERMMIL